MRSASCETQSARLISPTASLLAGAHQTATVARQPAHRVAITSGTIVFGSAGFGEGVPVTGQVPHEFPPLHRTGEAGDRSSTAATPCPTCGGNKCRVRFDEGAAHP